MSNGKKRRRDLVIDYAKTKNRSNIEVLPPRKKKLKVRQKPKAELWERLYVPKHLVTEEMKEAYEDVIENYLPEVDEYGEPILDRSLHLYGYKYHKKARCYSFCRGDRAKLEKYFGDFEIEDNTSDVRLKREYEFRGVPVDGELLPLRPQQKEAAKKIIEAGYGILKAPPRFGKTTVMSYLVCKLRRRTIVFVHQIDLARQFEAEFRKCTNVNKLEAKAGRKLIGIVSKWDQLTTLDVAIVTWQKFHAGKGGSKQLKKHRDSFGLMLVDEGHRFSSKFSSSVIDKINARYRIGVTATPDRKDKRDVIFKQIVGPVVVKGKTPQVPLHVNLVFTGFAPKFNRWTTYMKRIQESKTRNKLCLKKVVEEARAGRSVLVVATLRQHIADMVSYLKEQGIKAEGFHGGSRDRDGILKRAKNRTTQVIVGMRSMLTGVNVPCWDVIHIAVPTSNLPNHYQEFSRVRTPVDGKTHALVHHYIDNCGAARGCYKTCHKNYTDPELKPIYFVDKRGNILRTQPSLKWIEEQSKLGGKYDDESINAAGGGGKSQRASSLWGWSNSKPKKGRK